MPLGLAGHMVQLSTEQPTKHLAREPDALR
jgi:hypothetical protein